MSISQPLLDALYRIDREDELDYLPPDPYSAPGFLNFDPSNPWEADWQPFDSSFPPSLNWLQVFKDAIVGKPDTPYHSPPPPPNGREEDLPSKIFNSPEAHHARGSHGPRRHSHPHLFKGSHGSPHGHPHHPPPPPPPPHRNELLAPFKNTTLLVLGDSVDRGSIKYMSENLGLPIFVAQWEHANDLDHGKYMDNGVNPAYLPHQLWMPAPIDMLITNCFMYGLVSRR